MTSLPSFYSMQSVYMTLKCGGNIETFNTEKKLFLKLYKALIHRVVVFLKISFLKKLFIRSVYNILLRIFIEMSNLLNFGIFAFISSFVFSNTCSWRQVWLLTFYMVSDIFELNTS